MHIDGPDLRGILKITIHDGYGSSRSVLAYPGTAEFALIEQFRAFLSREPFEADREPTKVVELTRERARRKGRVSRH